MLTQIIRRQFLDYFKKIDHRIIPSSSIIPYDDPTLLFNNAGMNQFKDVFLGKSHRDYSRAATSQKCVRVGGKHNDLENVGHTNRHLTFFEMLGNFSFGDYFKSEAIAFAWEVSTSIFGFDADRIWPTVFREDDEAFEIWTQYVPAHRITRMNEKDNFWEMGEVGPCGPCSELYFDRGVEFGQATSPANDEVGDRFLEFWNLVFMQFNRQTSGKTESLPKPSIDTGAGLERILSLKMGVQSVFETDVLRGLISQIEQIAKISYNLEDARAAAFRVIADHLRCLAFAIADGAQPSNIDRGYVLRKVLRRAVRYGRQLGLDRPFLAEILPTLIHSMGEDYPDLAKSKKRIADLLTSEEEAFLRTLKKGGNILNQVIQRADQSNRTISGEEAFKLKDTYGLPLEEVLLIAKDNNLHVDEQKYAQLEEEARQRSRTVQKQAHQAVETNDFAEFVREKGPSQFLGYTHAVADSQVVGLIVNHSFVQRMQEGEKGLIILSQTPFYAEMGGQVGDTGQLEKTSTQFIVENTISPYKGLIAHVGQLKQGTIEVGNNLTASIDRNRRQKIANHHTATHLLQWALIQVLGPHIKQSGSIVEPNRLRFDFNHHQSLSIQEIRKIEELVNDRIRENEPIKTYELPYEEVQKREDIKQFFGEKYDSLVRVVDINYSKELCGGTHTAQVGTIGLFKIIKESSIAAGIRRIEAVSGTCAEIWVREQEDLLLHLADLLKAPLQSLEEKVKKLLEENKHLSEELKYHKKQQIAKFASELFTKLSTQDGLRAIIEETSLPLDDLRLCLDLLFDLLKNGVVVLGTVFENKGYILIKVSEEWIKKGVSAHELIKTLMPMLDGSGGGKAGLAQGGGKKWENLPNALEHCRELLKGIVN